MFRQISTSCEIWMNAPFIRASGALESRQFTLIDVIGRGTGGRMYHVLKKSTKENFALARHNIHTEVL